MSDDLEELDWPEQLHESEEEYGRLGDALDELRAAMQAVYERGLMTPELHADLLRLAKGVVRKLEKEAGEESSSPKG